MGTEKRERQKANRQVRLQEADAQARAAERRSRLSLFAILGIFAVAAILLFRFAGGDDSVDTASVGSDTVETASDDEIDVPELDPEVLEPTAPAVEIALPEPGSEITGVTECPPADGSAERVTSFESAPPMCIDPARSYTAVVETDKGDFTIDLDAEAAPETVNNFVTLARYNFYDGVAFHRIIPGFVVQGGDAVGPSPGVGNPGYLIEDELPTPDEDEASYQIGSLAMANSGPDSSGSQFFVVTGENGAALDPLYSRFGLVTEGMDVVMEIEAVGTAGGAPTEAIAITDITITES